MTTKHTQTPWRHRPDEFDDWGTIRGADNLPVANTCCEARIDDKWREENQSDSRAWFYGPPEISANARFIVQAVNAHDALVAALKSAHGCATLRVDGTCDGCQVSEALALAEAG